MFKIWISKYIIFIYLCITHISRIELVHDINIISLWSFQWFSRKYYYAIKEMSNTSYDIIIFFRLFAQTSLQHLTSLKCNHKQKMTGWWLWVRIAQWKVRIFLEFVHCFRCFRTPFFLFLYSPEPVSTAKICLRSFEEQTKRIRIRRYEKASKSHLS